MSASVALPPSLPLNHVFAGYAGPPFAIRLWDGRQWSSSPGFAPACTLIVHDPGVLAEVAAAPNEVTLGEAYIHDRIDVEGDLFSAFEVAEHLFSRPRPLLRRWFERAAWASRVLGRRLRLGARNSERRDRSSIAYHYDQPVEFFAPWLGPTLAYSCAYFRTQDQALDAAQVQKLELVCGKLRLQPGERFLDIGCGWGSLPLHAARRHGAQAYGVTLSTRQAETGRRRIAEAGLDDCCTIELRDYRKLDPASEPFDKIASIGMCEHVGLANLPLYFRIARNLLRPGGQMLNHAIARATLSPPRSHSFISHYVFPDGRLVTLPQLLKAAESEGLEIRDVENLREHYEITLRRWVAGLQENAAVLERLVPRTTYRIWLLYTAGCAAAFRRGDIAIYQTLLSRPDRGRSYLPLTREDWYMSPSGGSRRAS
jgi:cyclopropane-fatty-acyl-phospholipid synthase